MQASFNLNNLFIYIFGSIYKFFENTLKTEKDFHISASLVLGLLFTPYLIVLGNIVLLQINGIILNFLMSYIFIGFSLVLIFIVYSSYKKKFITIIQAYNEIRKQNTKLYPFLSLIIALLSIGSYLYLLLVVNKGHLMTMDFLIQT